MGSWADETVGFGESGYPARQDVSLDFAHGVWTPAGGLGSGLPESQGSQGGQVVQVHLS